MKSALLLAAIMCIVIASVAAAADDTRVYELRTYYAAPGKLDALHARFRDHTVKLFEKHGMTNVGYWVPIDNKENKLVYIIASANREAHARAFKAFGADPDWQKAVKESQANGRLMTRFESVFLNATDYSPVLKPAAAGDRVFELRTYTASPNNLGNLNARFRNHTLKLFEKHGMTNVGYFVPQPGQKVSSDNTLIYFLAHRSVEAAKASWGAFRQDADWLAAKKASEDKGGGSLTAQDGVKSEFLKATDYSPLK